MLYLSERTGRQKAAWRKPGELFGQDPGPPTQVALLDKTHVPAVCVEGELPIVAARLSCMRLLRPQQRGACWLGC